MSTPENSIEAVIGYTFARAELLREALTHPSYANEHPEAGANNQRLEFVGDAVLGLLVARLLCEALPQAEEGELSRRRAAVVCARSLAVLARELRLDEFLCVGRGEKLSGRRADSLLADAFEALMGAVFLDAGLAAVERVFGVRLVAAMAHADPGLDHKTRLQELCHARGLPAPRYEITGTQGPDHARSYACRVEVGERIFGAGEGSSKKNAEQDAAAKVLLELGEA